MTRYIDLHCDTVTMLDDLREDLAQNERAVCLDAMERGGALGQCFSAFVPTGLFPAESRAELPWRRFLQLADKKDRLLRLHEKRIRAVVSMADLAQCDADGLAGLIFTIEDAGVFAENLLRLDEAYARGVRIASLTWNHENTLAWPNSADTAVMARGLKPLGLELIDRMNRIGMLIDVSHLSDGGFWDVARRSKKPFAATHSNSRAMTNHPRNLTDAQIRALADCGGVMGLNFAADFLSCRGDGESRIADMVRHVLHIRDVGGSGVLALGTDFDGIEDRLQIPTPAQLPMLYDALRSAGLCARELDAMWQGNVLRVLREVWRA